MSTSSPEIVHEREPENSEPTPETLLAAGFYTPLGPAFRRNHAAFPAPSFIDSWRLAVSSALDADHTSNDGKGSEKELWSGGLTELEGRWASDELSLRVALQCAGNRRDELSAVQETQGLQWSTGTIANHLFAGVPVREILLSLGVPVDAPGDGSVRWHIHFESGVGPKEAAGSVDAWYGCSLPFESVMSKTAAPHLLAYEAQGKPLPLEHGAPLRLVTPGVIGARSIKWLERIRILPYPSTNSFMTHDYKILPPDIVDPTEEEKDEAMEKVEPLMAFGISCACLVAGGTTGVAEGWAIGAEGVPLDRVEVAFVDRSTAADTSRDLSPTEVRTAAAGLPETAWRSAELERGPAADGGADGREWGWVLWSTSFGEERSAETEGLSGGGSADHESTSRAARDGWVVARCVDREGRQQEREGQWNVRGVGMAGWSVKRWKLTDGQAARRRP